MPSSLASLKTCYSLAAVTAGVFLLFLPRIYSFVQPFWDPFARREVLRQAVWDWDGSYVVYRRYPTYCNPANGLCQYSPSFDVSGQCRVLNQNKDSFDSVRRSFNLLPPNEKLISASPQRKNVDGGTCSGTLYVLESETFYEGKGVLREKYCASPLVRYKRLANRLYAPVYTLSIAGWQWFPADCRWSSTYLRLKGHQSL